MWLTNAVMLSTNCSLAKLSLPTMAWTLPLESETVLDLAALELFDRIGDVAGHGAVLGGRHQLARAEDASQRSDDAHHVRGGKHDIKLEKNRP